MNNEEFKARIFAHLRRNYENSLSEKTMLFNSKISYRMIKRVLNSQDEWAIMLVDIDNLEFYKEIYGELATDKLLQTYSAIIKSSLEPSDYLGQISNEDFFIPDNISVAPDGFVPAFNLEELDAFLELNENLGNFSIEKKHIINLLKIARTSCSHGVSRTHIVNGLFDGTLPCEIFSDLGSGTMIYQNNYGGIRTMEKEDIPAVLNLIRPFVEQGILLPRTEESLLQNYNEYIVYELDGGLKACAALHFYDDNQGEIAAVAVDSVCSHMGIGPKLISYLLDKAKENKLSSVFILTTQTSDWFENQPDST